MFSSATAHEIFRLGNEVMLSSLLYRKSLLLLVRRFLLLLDYLNIFLLQNQIYIFFYYETLRFYFRYMSLVKLLRVKSTFQTCCSALTIKCTHPLLKISTYIIILRTVILLDISFLYLIFISSFW